MSKWVVLPPGDAWRVAADRRRDGNTPLRARTTPRLQTKSSQCDNYHRPNRYIVLKTSLMATYRSSSTRECTWLPSNVTIRYSEESWSLMCTTCLKTSYWQTLEIVTHCVCDAVILSFTATWVVPSHSAITGVDAGVTTALNQDWV